MAPLPPLILLLDDDLDFLEVNRSVLESKGYRVLCFSSPHDAFGQMGKETPSLVITDLMMQALTSGFSLAQKIKEDPRFRSVPVLIVTAVSNRLGLDFTPRGPEDLEAMHADAYVPKPVLPEALLRKVEELLARSTGKDAP